MSNICYHHCIPINKICHIEQKRKERKPLRSNKSRELHRLEKDEKQKRLDFQKPKLRNKKTTPRQARDSFSFIISALDIRPQYYFLCTECNRIATAQATFNDSSC